MSPEVYVTAGKDGRIALFLAPFNIVIIKESKLNNYTQKLAADILKSMFIVYIS